MIDQDGNIIPSGEETKKPVETTVKLTPYQIEQLDPDMHKELVRKASEELARLLHASGWTVVSLTGKEGGEKEGQTWKEMRFTYTHKNTKRYD
jgi:hypothetical protein